MPALETIQIPLGFVAPDFSLPEPASGKTVGLGELRSDKATVVMFICNHCPFVKHINKGLVSLASDYLPKGVAFVAISSNNVEAYPDDSPENMARVAEEEGYPFPYLYDETQEVAKAYKAVCTPDFSIFDGDLKCIYRGQLDDSRPGSGKPVTGADIRAALDAVLAGEAVNPSQRPSIGCSIKWKGAAPY